MNFNAANIEITEEVTEQKNYLFWVDCVCGQHLRVENPNKWEINLVGILQFRCPTCGIVSNVPNYPNIWINKWN